MTNDFFEGETMARGIEEQGRIVRATVNWALVHFTEKDPVKRMALVAGIPERTFKRYFLEAMKQSPMEYIQEIRIGEAKKLLEITDETVEQIASFVGYKDAAFLSKCFRRMIGKTPGQYRIEYIMAELEKEDASAVESNRNAQIFPRL